MLVFLGLILFIALVVVHEYGHFIAARRNGVEVEEFGIGFPPRLWGKKMKSGFEFTLNLLPLGGFVRLKGEHDSDTEKGSYGAASLKAKVQIMVAGVAMNLLAAFVVLTLVALIGMPRLITPEFVGEEQYTVASDTKVVREKILNEGVVRAVRVVENTPAKNAGIAEGDEIVSVDGVAIDDPEQLREATQARSGQNVAIVLKRDNKQELTKYLRLNDRSPYLGISSDSAEFLLQTRRSTWSAPIVAVGVSAQMTKLTFQGLWSAIEGLGRLIAGTVTFNTTARQDGQAQASSQVSGPLGIYFVLKDGASQGIGFILFIIGIISLTLAIMNVLPIPALDGGRLFVTLLFRALKRPLRPKTEDLIHGSGFAALMLLFVLITVVDVKRFF